MNRKYQFEPVEADIPLQALQCTAAMRSLCAISFVDCSIGLLPGPECGKTAELRRFVAEYDAALVTPTQLRAEPRATDQESES